MTKKLYILGGGTNSFISNHLSLAAPAYGQTAKKLYEKFSSHLDNKMQTEIILTKMANPLDKDAPDTPEDVEALVDKLVADLDTRVIIFNVAMVDYKPEALSKEVFDNPEYTYYQDVTTSFGKYAGRLSTSKHLELRLNMTVQDKIIQKIRKERKDILLVGFKTTCGATKEEQFQKGLKLCKDASANIVFINDVDKDRINNLNNLLKEKENLESILHLQHSISINLSTIEKEIQALQNNGLVTPEESSYWYNTRDEALDGLVSMVLERSKGEFSSTTLLEGERILWNNPLIPDPFKEIFNFIRDNNGWHIGPTGKTSGHYGIKISEYESICSIRKQNYNDIENVGMVRVITDDPDNIFGYKDFFNSQYSKITNQITNLETYLNKLESWDRGRQEIIYFIKELKNKLNTLTLEESNKVLAFGAKPSVGDVTQRELFKRYPEYQYIIHFHSKLKHNHQDDISIASQFEFECGSKGLNGCSTNTANNMKEHKLSDGSIINVVHLDHHGPNIMFSNKNNPELIKQFILNNWDIGRKTDGLFKDNI